MKENKLSHVDDRNNPTMVDVSQKAVTLRAATAQSIIELDNTLWKQLDLDNSTTKDIYTKKGPVFQTAVIAGTMAVKKTSDLIPFCHPLAIERCDFHIQPNENYEICIECTVTVSSKTGVEMEALTGASMAALTVYDMCKALSPTITIKKICLLSKTGGKSDFNSD